jgi:hypothetical protein
VVLSALEMLGKSLDPLTVLDRVLGVSTLIRMAERACDDQLHTDDTGIDFHTTEWYSP